MSEALPPNSSTSHSLKAGDVMRFVNESALPIRIRVTTQCGTESEAELHPGAVFVLKAGTASAKVEILPPEEEYKGIRAAQ